jgi:hypothetical protein
MSLGDLAVASPELSKSRHTNGGLLLQNEPENGKIRAKPDSIRGFSAESRGFHGDYGL